MVDENIDQYIIILAIATVRQRIDVIVICLQMTLDLACLHHFLYA